MLIRLALRNLMLHRVKTLIIGGMVVLGVFLSFVGTALLDRVSDNLARTFTDQFTGDLLIRDKNQLSGVFGSSGDGGEASGIPVLKPLPHLNELLNYLQQNRDVESMTRLYVGYGMPNITEISSDFLLLWGIQPSEYFSFFESIEVVEGRRLADGERGLMLHESVRKNLEQNYSVSLAAGTNIQINNFGVTGLKIRTVPIVGIFRYSVGNDRFFIPNFLDIETARLLFDRPAGAALEVELKREATSLLGEVSLDDLFSEEIIGQAQTTRVDPFAPLELPVQTAVEGTGRGSWTHVLLRLKQGSDPKQVEEELSAAFEERGWELEAQDWFSSAQPDSSLALGLRLILSALVFLISVVSVIVMMNTLIASVMERTAELGTMRALGARRSFVARMLFVETFVLVALSTAVAIVLGTLLLAALNIVGIPAPDPSLEAYFGGKVFHPSPTVDALTGSLFLMLMIAFFSWLFPVLTAVKISPLKAMGTE